ncbi:MAG: disulfide bond formation protein B [Gammaproteobacteria bacterium]|nr:disulfide bond formation protein B [Gammaproteobacteria bacterium]
MLSATSVRRVRRSTDRLFYAGLAGICIGLLGFGYYLQYGRGLEPCPLCVLQRIAYLAITTIAIVAAVHAGAGLWRRLYGGVIALCALLGGAVAARQVWLQHLPADRVPECGPGLGYMLEVFPLNEVLAKVLTGSGECAEAGWTFLTLSIAEWSLLFFAALALCAVAYAFRPAAA